MLNMMFKRTKILYPVLEDFNEKNKNLKKYKNKFNK